VPELKNEVPTDQELRDYFMEHYGYLVDLLNLHNAGSDAESEVTRALRLLPGLGCKGFLSTALESIFASLQRLNRLPRTDPFWRNTNRRPTVYKLNEFCQLVLQRDPNDALALWTVIAMRIFHGRDNFYPREWRRLYESGQLETGQVVCAALCSGLTGGDTEGFIELLIEIGAVEEARTMLEQFRASGSELIAEWALRALGQVG
jgi:hypothetical protein